MRSLFYLLGLLSISYSLQAQNHPTCDGARYVSEVFTVVDTTHGVLYGNGNTFSGNNQDLFLDVYEPSGDVATARPTIVLAFGGSFVGGERDDMDALCRYYARRGYVAVTIDYRLYDGGIVPLPTAADFTDVVIKAVSDMKAAIRFLREDAATNNRFRIDTNYIFAGGVSAGGILANHVGYLQSTDSIGSDVQTAINNNGGWEGNSSNNVGLYGSQVQGIMNFSGALRDVNYIDSNDPPLFSVHDDGDRIVPFGGGNASVFNIPIIYVEGSQLMNQQADAVSVPNSLIVIPNSNGHVSYFQSNAAQWADSVQAASSQFLHDEVICPIIVSALQPQDIRAVASKFFPNPAVGALVIAFEELPSTYSLRLVDAMGRVVYAQEGIQDERFVLPRGNWAAGLYQVQVQFDDADYPPVQRGIVFQ